MTFVVQLAIQNTFTHKEVLQEFSNSKQIILKVTQEDIFQLKEQRNTIDRRIDFGVHRLLMLQPLQGIFAVELGIFHGHMR